MRWKCIHSYGSRGIFSVHPAKWDVKMTIQADPLAKERKHFYNVEKREKFPEWSIL